MGEAIDKAKGYTNEAIGKVKRAIGDETNNEQLRAEGDAQEAKGDLQKSVGALKGALGNNV